MDWCLDTTVAGSAARTEADVLAHLSRHAQHQELVELAQPLVRGALTLPANSPSPAFRWVSLDWEDGAARLTVRDIEAGTWPHPGPRGEGLEPWGPGLALAHQAVPLLAEHARPGALTLGLGVVSPPQADLDPEPASRPDGPLSPQAALAEVAAFLAQGTERGRSPEEMAAWAGATLGRAGEERFRSQTGSQGSLSASEVGDAIVAAEQAIGGDFFVVGTNGRRVVLGNRRCPFGEAVVGSPALCRVTSAIAGGISARAAGSATVSLDERRAVGDHQCRLVVDLGAVPTGNASHHYRWPATGWQVDETEPDHVRPKGFLISLSLRLPRDRVSVPVIRHLIEHALEEVGVVSETAADVELALAEACANVLEHSGPGDAYDVSITIGPVNCEIRVTDVGRGFDFESLTARMADTDAESGRGIALMRALMDQVRFTSEPEQGTIVHLVKRLEFDDSVPARRLMLAALEGGDPDT